MDKTEYKSVVEAVLDLKLDRRVKWFDWQGSLVRNHWVTLTCSGCDGSRCAECGGSGKRRQCFPEYARTTEGDFVKIIAAQLNTTT